MALKGTALRGGFKVWCPEKGEFMLAQKMAFSRGYRYNSSYGRHQRAYPGKPNTGYLLVVDKNGTMYKTTQRAPDVPWCRELPEISLDNLARVRRVSDV